MIKVYCDRCKKQIPSSKSGRLWTGYDFANSPDIPVGSYRGGVSEKCEDCIKKDDGSSIYYYAGRTLCPNCQKELDLMVTEYMGVKKRK